MRLVTATEAQASERDRLTHAAWGQRLSLDDFRAREIRLRNHPWSRSGMTTWLWTGAGGEILSSCESFAMRSRFRGAWSVSFGIASVFTEVRLRGRGHALAMMEAVTAALRRRAPEAHGVILFSEVGATLYERAGFQPLHLHDRVLEARPAAGAARRIGEAEVPALLARMAPPDDPFVIWPTAEQIDWHLERARFYAERLGRTLPTCGVELGEARALWCADFKNDRLAVLLATAPDEAAGAALLREAQGAAAAAGLAEVRVWETPSLPLPATLGRRISRDDDALPMLLPFAAGLDAGAWREVPRALWL